jgi:single-strand DNA-binding protein
MASFNKVILMGNLTRDPQVRYTPGGTAVTEVGLAVNRTWFDKATNQRRDETTFVDVTFWGRQAEIVGEYLTKGSGVLIEGRLHLDQWDDKESGQKRSRLKVIAENMTMLPKGSGSGGGGGGGSRSGGNQSSQSPPAESAQMPVESPGGSDYGNDDFGGGPGDVPF